MAKVKVARPRTGKTVTADVWVAMLPTGADDEKGRPLFAACCGDKTKTAIRQWLRDTAPAGEYAIHAVTDSGILVTEEPTVKRTVGKKAAPEVRAPQSPAQEE